MNGGWPALSGSNIPARQWSIQCMPPKQLQQQCEASVQRGWRLGKRLDLHSTAMCC
jgi:hypothetical protein